ncbi:gamma-tubulin complex DGRIP91/SPC98 component [Cylindrobasidium torrendii FP15055 ss-10]|uniref:Gamma-tubulin complex DGRIP91/SPC98 component n=1 Tax=Cylindrobasidium torrendii FP15055 ss-10 TaxID=1314674 RepID=A0A0D7BMP4_9AGAR|nr:gamma-tubulin complex DGRIP91/SPC98 component [Cylindrobasidium torrendii FP15055 ss-10]
MASTPSSLEHLILNIVPSARDDLYLRDELVLHCKEILNSHIGENHDPDLGHLADLVKRQLLHSSPSGSAANLKFTNLLSRLLDQSVLSRKHAAVHFLYALASSQTPKPPSIMPTLLPSTMVPPPSQRRPPISSPTDTPLDTLPRGPSKAEILSEYRKKAGNPRLPEYLLLRDTLYLLQGISGKYVRFAQQDAEAAYRFIFVEDSRYSIPEPIKALIHRLSEVGYLYTRVDNFVRGREGAAAVGMIEQSLCHHLQTQLTEYYRLIAILESQMPPPPKDDLAALKQEETGLTLRRLDVWITDWRLRMRMMSVCVEGARDAHGGALVNLIHSYTDNGDPFVRKFTDQLLEEVSKPFFATLHKWLFSGDLYDPFNEFFVAGNPALAHLQYLHPSSIGGQLLDEGFGATDNEEGSTRRHSTLQLWQSKYLFRKDMLPMFVGEAFGRKIFSTGKSLNFIRYSCHDSDWVATREKMTDTGGTLKYSDINGLERSIDAAYQVASQRLFEVFIDKFKLLDHLIAIKNYLLLGHGDFVEQLMDALGPSLVRPANTLFRHNLTATLESAIRSSNAQYDSPDILRRLDARMLEYTHGEIGWDVFTLEYKVDPPIDTVIDPGCMIKYLKLFNHLWQMKRIESTLGQGWMRVVGDSRTFLKVPELEYQWHQIRLVNAEMIHFIRQMQAYCYLEVIECSWKVLMDFINKKEGDLDALIDAHRAYLDRMVKKVLLISPKAGREEVLLAQLRDLFSLILQFREASDNFYNFCLSESVRRDRELDAERGVYTGKESEADALPRSVIDPVREYGTTFFEKAQILVQHLQVHPDLDCRFLAVRLNFADFYRKKDKEK